ncbi:hypothetical protein ES703_99338 [subsurface metagenome]
MKILVCGDRDWGSKLIVKAWRRFVKPTLVFEGGYRGADQIAAKAADELGISFMEFPARWGQYGKAAGPIRNRKMLDEKPDLVLAFHFDITESRGTADTLFEAEKRGIPYAVIGL